jgi:O-antigen ligase
MAEDLGSMANAPHYNFMWVTSEYLINCVKWVLPAILLYDGCRTRGRIMAGLGAILAQYFLVATQVVNHMPISAVTATAVQLSHMASRDLDRAVGYFRTEISMMLAGASWGVLCMIVLVEKRRWQLLLVAAAAWVALGQALTGGRAGYVTWGLIGLVLCSLRLRKMLPLIPVVVIAVCLFLPAVRDRMLQGIVGGAGGSSSVDTFAMTSGRTVAWAHVIPKIKQSPVFGYGRQAMIRIGIYQKIIAEANDPSEAFPHPHNAYLEILLDDGLFGFFLIMPVYFVSLVQSFKLLVDRSDPLFSAVGGVASALILGLLFASMGSQSFYPKESSVGMWAAIGLMLRVYVERARARETGASLFGEEESAQEIQEPPAADVIGHHPFPA